MKPRLTGLIAAPFTPLQSDGSLNLEVIEAQARVLETNGVAGAFICGTTGEGFSLTTQERQQVAERWMEVAPASLKVIVHVGHNALGDCRTLAAHAEKIGANAIAAIGPSFFNPAAVQELVEFCAPVAESAPGLPFYYYHMPSMTGVDLPMTEFLPVAAKRIATFAGIKFTHENLMEYHQCLRFEGGRYDILFGRDEILLSALAIGAAGAVGSTYNYMAPLYHRVMEAFTRGDLDEARRQQMAAVSIIAVMAKHGGLAAGKAMMKLIGIDCGPVRPPLRNLRADELETLHRELEQVGFPSVALKAAVSESPLVAGTTT